MWSVAQASAHDSHTVKAGKNSEARVGLRKYPLGLGLPTAPGISCRLPPLVIGRDTFYIG
ncbi:hypothetical protein G5B00_05470 [Parapedobacter sp. SGR-10]|uniref:hypothetical protein n=1 Tax=Parapedobacter sp. SGR-10 TaxID=2710879 RepID=UPI0013D79261|nr:hypothetical protein [Parapedobacter sp. SGR-10]NGF55959.1 hypothetical protein [Parapedobacter sp. SGR-10]